MRTLTDIIPPSRRGGAPVSETPDSREPLNLATPKPHRFPYALVGGMALIIIASIGALMYFSRTEVVVTPKAVTAAVQASLSATNGTGSLPFEIITAQKIAQQAVKSSGTKSVTASASGKVTVYNTQSKPQALVANTRFASKSGQIYRIKSAVTVPAGTKEKPGSVVTKVYADQPGSSYNLPSGTSLTLPGFSGTPQATQVYARAQEAIAGGASGLVPIVEPTLASQTSTALKSALDADLAQSITSQVRDGYVLLPGASATTYEELPAAPSQTTGEVMLREQGTITAVIFPKTALADAVARSLTNLEYQGGGLTFTSTDKLMLAAQSMPTADTSNFSFTLGGTASLVYTVSHDRIASAVAGKSRSEAAVALSSFPDVQRAVVILRPFWRQTFPQDPSEITVTASNEK